MIRLRRLFENQFADPAISADEFRDFTEDFLGRLAVRTADATHGALYTSLHATLDPLFAAFDGALSRRATVLAAQESGTLSKDDAHRLFKSRVRQREGRIRDAFGQGTPGYEAFFPRGLTEYSSAPLARVPALLDRFIAAAEQHAAQVGADLAPEFRELKTTFTTAREGQVDRKGEVAEARAAVTTARTALELATMTALLDLAKAHLGHPEVADTLLNQSLLEDPTRSQRDEEKPAGPVNGPITT